MADTNQIEQWFQTLYDNEVHLAYQRMGSKLRGTVRTKTAKGGSEIKFAKAGTGEVGTKGRGGNVPIFNSDKSMVSCAVDGYWGGAIVEEFDQIQHDKNERDVITRTAAGAHGRKTDELIFNQIKLSTNATGDFSTGLTQPLIQGAIEALNTRDVLDDGERYAPVGPHQWEELLKIDAFAKADYIGTEQLPWLNGAEAKRWRGILWFAHSGIPLSGTQATCAIYHKSAIGHGIWKELETTWSWENTKGYHFANSRMFQGSVLIDATGVQLLQCKNDTAL